MDSNTNNQYIEIFILYSNYITLIFYVLKSHTKLLKSSQYPLFLMIVLKYLHGVDSYVNSQRKWCFVSRLICHAALLLFTVILSVSIYRWKWIILFGVGHNINDEQRLILIQFKIHCVWMQGVMLLHPWFLIHRSYKLLLLSESIPVAYFAFESIFAAPWLFLLICMQTYLSFVVLCSVMLNWLLHFFLVLALPALLYFHAVKNLKSVVTRWEMLQKDFYCS